MKKYLLLLSLFITVKQSVAQIYFSEDFTFGIPQNFALYNLDNLTPAQPDLIGLKDSAWITREVYLQGYWGSRAALATSWMLDTIGPVDDWMVTPLINIGNDAMLKWTALSITSSGIHRSNYQVYLSVSADWNDLQNATLIYEVADTGESVKSVQHYVDLSAYAGMTRCIAFRNYNYGFSLINNLQGANTLMIDDVMMYESFLSTQHASDDKIKLIRDHNQYGLYTASNTHWQLADIQGRVIHSGNTVPNQYDWIDVHPYPSGMYLLHCITPEYKHTFKLIKE